MLNMQIAKSGAHTQRRVNGVHFKLVLEVLRFKKACALGILLLHTASEV